jgi:hypothetical protein
MTMGIRYEMYLEEALKDIVSMVAHTAHVGGQVECGPCIAAAALKKDAEEVRAPALTRPSRWAVVFADWDVVEVEATSREEAVAKTGRLAGDVLVTQALVSGQSNYEEEVVAECRTCAVAGGREGAVPEPMYSQVRTLVHVRLEHDVQWTYGWLRMMAANTKARAEGGQASRRG